MTPQREDSSESNSSTSLIVPTLKSDLPPRDIPCFRSAYFLARPTTPTNNSPNDSSPKVEVQSSNCGKKIPLGNKPCSNSQNSANVPENSHKITSSAETHAVDKKDEEKLGENVTLTPKISNLPLEVGQVFVYDDFPKSLNEPPCELEKSPDRLSNESYLDEHSKLNLEGVETSQNDKTQCNAYTQGYSCSKEERKFDPEDKEKNSCDENQSLPHDVTTKNGSQSNCNETISMASPNVAVRASQLNFSSTPSSQNNRKKTREKEQTSTAAKKLAAASEKIISPKNVSPILKFFPSPKEVVISSYDNEDYDVRSITSRSSGNKTPPSNLKLTPDNKQEDVSFDDSVDAEDSPSLFNFPALADASMGVLR